MDRITGQRQIWVDFDGTVVFHDNPFVGEELDGCVAVLKKLIRANHELMLVTMRTDRLLDEAVEWFKVRDIELIGVNRNPFYETGSRKIYAHLIIDDKCLGIPKIHDYTIHKKPFVDWKKVDVMLQELGYYERQRKPHAKNKPVLY